MNGLQPQTVDYPTTMKVTRPDLPTRIQNRMLSLNKELHSLGEMTEILQGNPDLAKMLDLMDKVEV